jgi:hypothetical protein
MKSFTYSLLLGALICGVVGNVQADRGRHAAAGLGGFAAGTVLGAALGGAPVYYDYYDDYDYVPYNPYWGYPRYRRYGYGPAYRYDYYGSPYGVPYRPKN